MRLQRLLTFSLFALLIVLISCGGGSSSNNGGNGSNVIIFVDGRVTTGGGVTIAVVDVLDDASAAIGTATVTVNGNTLAFGSQYTGVLASTVNTSGSVTLSVTYNGLTVTETLTMPEAPDSVSNNAETDATQPITISWTFPAAAPADPSEEFLAVDGSDTVSSNNYEQEFAGGTLTHDIPGGTLLTNSSVDVIVGGMESVSVDDAKAGSQFAVINTSSVNFTTDP